MKKSLFLAAGVMGSVFIVSALAFVASAANAKNSAAQEFVEKASVANEFEIQSSQLALDKSQNEQVKSFAQHMVDDHTKVGDNLTETLKSANSQIQPADSLEDKHQKMIDKLDGLSGKDFDRQYISMQLDAHKQAVKLFGSYAAKGKDPAIRQFAADTLPTLQDHLREVKKLKDAE